MIWTRRVLVVVVSVAVSIFLAQIIWKVAKPMGSSLSKTILKSFDSIAEVPRMGMAYPTMEFSDENDQLRQFQLVSLKNFFIKDSHYELSIALDAYLAAELKLTPFELEKSLYHSIQNTLRDSSLVPDMTYVDSQVKKAIFDTIKIEPFSLYFQKQKTSKN